MKIGRMREYESAIQTETEELPSIAILRGNMILDISTLYSYDTLRVLTPQMRGMDTPPYIEMRIKERKKKRKVERERRERDKERDRETERERQTDRERLR